MSKISQNLLLQRAEGEFLKGDFQNSLRTYGLILRDYPTLDEAKIGVYLSDLGTENKDEAQALFDYYQIIKSENDNAVEIIDEMIDTLDTSKHYIQEFLLNPIQEEVEYGNGIKYSDFLELINSRGSFKEAFEDIMFSTKVIISNKNEFIDFVTQLATNGFDEMALSYLDSSSKLFGNDQDVLVLYDVINGVKK
jgi:hypothetical protein